MGSIEIERFAGSGNFSEVYLGRDRHSQLRCAVKRVRQSADATTRKTAAAYLKKEAAALRRLDHPGIVKFRGVEEIRFPDGQSDVALIMEWVSGGTLRDWLEQHRGDRRRHDYITRCVQLTDQVLDALAYAHERGFIHRDIKPANIMMATTAADEGTFAGVPKIADFGLARLATDLTGTRIGTVVYCAPEQFTTGFVGPQTDLYAVGCVLYELLTGKRAFAGDEPQILFAKLHGVQPHLPDELSAFRFVLQRSLAAEPEKRFPNAAAMRSALREARGHHGLVRAQPKATRPTAGKPAAPPVVPPAKTTAMPDETETVAQPRTQHTPDTSPFTLGEWAVCWAATSLAYIGLMLIPNNGYFFNVIANGRVLPTELHSSFSAGWISSMISVTAWLLVLWTVQRTAEPLTWLRVTGSPSLRSRARIATVTFGYAAATLLAIYLLTALAFRVVSLIIGLELPALDELQGRALVLFAVFYTVAFGYILLLVHLFVTNGAWNKVRTRRAAASPAP